MRRDVFTIFLGVCLLAVQWAALPVAYADDYASGVTAYKQKDYTRAAQYFQGAVKANPQNAQSTFYLGLALTHLGKLSEAQQAFVLVTQMVPANDPMAAKARNNISVLTERQMHTVSSSQKATALIKTSMSSNSKPNYLTHVLESGKVTHYDPAKMPLRIYIRDGSNVPGWNAGMRDKVMSAMSVWRSATHGKVSFLRVYREEEADILVHWTKNLSENKLGVSHYRMMANTITFTDVELATHYSDGVHLIPDTQLAMVYLHEFGHAIGIKGHSPYPDDIMYFSAHPGQASTLSERDKNTINMLYGFEADVANASGMSTQQAKQYFELVEKGNAELGKKQYGAAMSYYRRAIYLNSSATEAKYGLAYATFNQGITFGQQQNYSQARTYFLETTQLLQAVLAAPNPPNEARSLMADAQKYLALSDRALK